VFTPDTCSRIQVSRPSNKYPSTCRWIQVDACSRDDNFITDTGYM